MLAKVSAGTTGEIEAVENVKIGAGDGNRTRIGSLEGYCPTFRPRPLRERTISPDCSNCGTLLKDFRNGAHRGIALGMGYVIVRNGAHQLVVNPIHEHAALPERRADISGDLSGF